MGLGEEKACGVGGGEENGEEGTGSGKGEGGEEKREGSTRKKRKGSQEIRFDCRREEVSRGRFLRATWLKDKRWIWANLMVSRALSEDKISPTRIQDVQTIRRQGGKWARRMGLPEMNPVEVFGEALQVEGRKTLLGYGPVKG
ncbi:hypothetical protein Droror1_Dr00003063 [Drosera rotundifolia]